MIPATGVEQEPIGFAFDAAGRTSKQSERKWSKWGRIKPIAHGLSYQQHFDIGLQKCSFILLLLKLIREKI